MIKLLSFLMVLNIQEKQNELFQSVLHFWDGSIINNCRPMKLSLYHVDKIFGLSKMLENLTKI